MFDSIQRPTGDCGMRRTTTTTFTLNYGKQKNVKYWHNPAHLSQEDALKICEEEGATLVQVDSQAEHDALLEGLKSFNSIVMTESFPGFSAFWSGCKSTANVRDFKWVDGTFSVATLWCASFRCIYFCF